MTQRDLVHDTTPLTPIDAGIGASVGDGERFLADASARLAQ